jgi:hypothetical protein
MTRRHLEFNRGGQGAAGLGRLAATLEQIAVSGTVEIVSTAAVAAQS